MEYRTLDALEDNPKTFLDRVEISGSLALQADITAVYAEVWQYDSYQDAVGDTNGTQVLGEIAYATANVIFNALQTGGMWTRDATGYNFKATVPASYFPTGGKYYRVEFRFDRAAAGEDDFYLAPWILRALPIAGS